MKKFLDQLKELKTRLTPEYLSNSDLSVLRSELNESEKIAKKAIEFFDGQHPDDVDEVDSTTWRNTKSDVIKLNEDIKSLIQPVLSQFETPPQQNGKKSDEKKPDETPTASTSGQENNGKKVEGQDNDAAKGKNTESLKKFYDYHNELKNKLTKVDDEYLNHAEKKVLEELLRKLDEGHKAHKQLASTINTEHLNDEEQSDFNDAKASMKSSIETTNAGILKQIVEIQNNYQQKLIEENEQRLEAEKRIRLLTEESMVNLTMENTQLRESINKSKREATPQNSANYYQPRNAAQPTTYYHPAATVQSTATTSRASTLNPVIETILDDDEPIVMQAQTRRPRVDASMQFKLDSIHLPYFNDDLTEWAQFKEFFTYLIHENENLSDILKFHQLRTHLKGTAYDTIRGYQFSGVNYASAWLDLSKRFDRVEEIVHEYIRKFMEVPAIIHKATFGRVRAIIDATNQMTRALPSHGINVKDWDAIIVFIVISKLDEETRFDWKQHKKEKNKLTKLQELLDFLETRAIELQPQQGERFSQMLKNNQSKTPRKIFQVTGKQGESSKQSTLKCPICNGPHRIRNCDKLKSECAKVRTNIIRTLKVCFKCLLKHQFGMCESDDCAYCGGPHHILLCYKKENDQKNQQEKSRNLMHVKPPAEKDKPSTSTQTTQWAGNPRKRMRFEEASSVNAKDWGDQDSRKN